MKLLLDTHILIWAAAEPKRLSAKTRLMLEDTANDLAFSVASLWEIAIKTGGAGRQMPVNVERLRTKLLANGYAELNITGDHALAVQHLPPVHRDPFDRILIAQARVEGMSLLTKDKRMIEYGAPVMKA